MIDIDLIIPCYGKSELINRGLSSIATQWKKEYVHVTLVNDKSPNTDCNYQDLVDAYSNLIDIRCISTPENCGQGLARQYGIDNTTHDWFMFMDEDDQIGNGLSLSVFGGTAEYHYADTNADTGDIKIEVDFNKEPVKDKHGNCIVKTKKPDYELAVVSGPLFEFDDAHTHIIPAENRIWLNSKLYNRKFINKHNIRFNKEQSRHAEDYYFMSCFFHCLDNDTDYCGVLLDNEGLYYLWYPNQKSQSRIDEHYTHMLSGYTMDGSLNVLKFIKNGPHKIKWSSEIQKQYNDKVLNMTIYCFFTIMSFIKHVATTDYVPTLEDDWIILRDASKELRNIAREVFSEFTYMRKIDEIYKVKNYSDVQYTEPWLTFDEYILEDNFEPFNWSFETLLESKKKYKFDDSGKLISKG